MLMQYLFPLLSGRLWPRCVPSNDTVSPFGRQRTFSQTTSSSRKLGQPWSIDSSLNWVSVLPMGATNSGFPVTESKKRILSSWIFCKRNATSVEVSRVSNMRCLRFWWRYFGFAWAWFPSPGRCYANSLNIQRSVCYRSIFSKPRLYHNPIEG